MNDWIRRIENVGYCKIPGVYSSTEMKRTRDLVVSWAGRAAAPATDTVPRLATGSPIVYNLQNKDYYFLKVLFACQEVERILVHFLNDQWYKQIPASEPNYILRSFLARSSEEALPLHIDSFVPYIGSHVFVMQCSIVLEEQSESNGCTIVVPASHKSGEYVDQSARSRAVPIAASAGDVVIWDSRLWHGTGRNESGRTRWAMVATFARWWIKQWFNVTGNLPEEIYSRLSRKEKAILGFCSVPFNHEQEGIDLKQGYESLHDEVSDYRA